MPKEKPVQYDVAVLGAGPAGVMAAITAANNGAKVVLIEKNNELLKKLLLTGNGRCNITNAEFNLRNLVSNYNKGGEFLFHAFAVFGPERTIKFFSEIGLKTKTEKNGRVFPASGRAEDVRIVFKKQLEKNNVEVIFGRDVKEINSKNKKINKLVLVDGTEVKAEKYIICAGGKSYSKTGSDGSVYKMVEALGHKIEKLTPSLVPVKLKEEWIKGLQGVSLEKVGLTVFQNNKKQCFEQGDIMFTHYGLSGPAVLNISGKIGQLLEKGEAKISIDLFPLLNNKEVMEGFEEILKKYPRQAIKNILSKFAPQRFVEAFLQVLNVDMNKVGNNMSKIEREMLVKNMQDFQVTPTELMGWDLAMVTAGGVSLAEIDHKTMQSKIIPNLYFAGEIMDIDAKTGGFNLQMCWSTGYLAGKNT